MNMVVKNQNKGGEATLCVSKEISGEMGKLDAENKGIFNAIEKIF